MKRERIVAADRFEVTQRCAAAHVVFGMDLEPCHPRAALDDRLMMRKAQPYSGELGDQTRHAIPWRGSNRHLPPHVLTPGSGDHLQSLCKLPSAPAQRTRDRA